MTLKNESLSETLEMRITNPRKAASIHASESVVLIYNEIVNQSLFDRSALSTKIIDIFLDTISDSKKLIEWYAENRFEAKDSKKKALTVELNTSIRLADLCKEAGLLQRNVIDSILNKLINSENIKIRSKSMELSAKIVIEELIV